MKSKLFTAFSFALLLSLAFAFSANAQDAPKTHLPKFKKNALSLYLSPSNQIRNIGFGEYGSEKQRMNEVADVMVPILEKQGIKVYRNDPEKSIRDYTAEANKYNADLYLAVHSNAFNGKARGTEVYCHRKGGEGERFAKLINEELLKIYSGPNRGVRESCNRYGEGKPMHEPAASNMPACLVEIAFHDNEEDGNWIIANIDEIALALSRAVLLHFAQEHPDQLLK